MRPAPGCILAHALGVKAFAYRRVKNDVRDTKDLADLLRMGRLAEGWIAPPHLRQLRELVRYRAKLVALRSALKAQVHAVLAKEGVAVPMSDLFGKQGMALLRDTRLGTCHRMRIDSLLDLIDAFDHEVMFLSDATAANRSPASEPRSPPSLSSRTATSLASPPSCAPGRD